MYSSFAVHINHLVIEGNRERAGVAGYALVRDLCARWKNSYAESYARLMRMIFCGIPLWISMLSPIESHEILLSIIKSYQIQPKSIESY